MAGQTPLLLSLLLLLAGVTRQFGFRVPLLKRLLDALISAIKWMGSPADGRRKPDQATTSLVTAWGLIGLLVSVIALALAWTA